MISRHLRLRTSTGVICCEKTMCICISLQWRHNEHDGVSNHQPHHYLLNRLVRRISKKTSKLRVTDLCAGNSPVIGEFPSQMASNAENVSIWWCHYVSNPFLTLQQYIFAGIPFSRKMIGYTFYIFNVMTVDDLVPHGSGVGVSDKIFCVKVYEFKLVIANDLVILEGTKFIFSM